MFLAILSDIKNIFQTLKIVHHSPEFLPYVIFLSAPSPACLKQLGSHKKNEADNDFLSSVSRDYFVPGWRSFYEGFSLHMKGCRLQAYIYVSGGRDPKCCRREQENT